MKFRKKTMATLFAAILIAMMGVMPALAASDTSTLSAFIAPEMVGITAADVDFGTVTKGQTSVGSTLVITLTGETGYSADLSATLTDETPAFYAPLTLNTVTVPNNVETTFATAVTLASSPISYAISFDVPSLAIAGDHEATLTIFAVYNP